MSTHEPNNINWNLAERGKNTSKHFHISSDKANGTYFQREKFIDSILAKQKSFRCNNVVDG